MKQLIITLLIIFFALLVAPCVDLSYSQNDASIHGKEIYMKEHKHLKELEDIWYNGSRSLFADIVADLYNLDLAVIDNESVEMAVQPYITVATQAMRHMATIAHHNHLLLRMRHMINDSYLVNYCDLVIRRLHQTRDMMEGAIVLLHRLQIFPSLLSHTPIQRLLGEAKDYVEATLSLYDHTIEALQKYRDKVSAETKDQKKEKPK